MMPLEKRKNDQQVVPRKVQDSKQFFEYATKSGILPKWHTMSWDDYVNDEHALKYVQSYLKRKDEVFADGVGLFLHGGNGTGKTMLMCLTFLDLMRAGYSVKIISMSTLISKFATFDRDEIKKIQKILQTVSFLGIEEIGKEYSSVGSKEIVRATLDMVIRFRVQMKKPIWCTSNYAPEAIKDEYTGDIASMLRECCLPLHVKGEDYRIKIKNKLKKKYDV